VRRHYYIQPAAGNNAVQAYRGVTGTLTLATPAPYSQLFVIAHGGSGGGAGSGVVNYDDGSTLAFTYNSFDWCGNHPEAAIAALGRGCNNTDAGNFFQWNNCNGVQIYETAIATDNTKNVVSVTFYGHVGANFGGLSNVYALSGQ
jgi:hypothetical protein